jgi:hypothetical protein
VEAASGSGGHVLAHSGGGPGAGIVDLAVKHVADRRGCFVEVGLRVEDAYLLRVP